MINKNILKITTGSLLLGIISFAGFQSVIAKSNEDEDPTSYPVSFALQSEYIMRNGKVIKNQDGNFVDLNFTEGLLDKNTKLFYYTTKSSTSWGADKFINVYSLSDQKIVNKIEFDNSGYYKYPISISPHADVLVLAESSQSAGSVKLILVNIKTGSTLLELENVYSPTATWKDNNTLVFLNADNSCDGSFCTQISVSLNKLNIENKTKKSYKVGDKNKEGVLPLVDDIVIKGSNFVLGRKNNDDGKFQQEILVDVNF